MATDVEILEAMEKGAPLPGVNFERKRDRKRRRKALVRNRLANMVASRALDREDKADFYRKLRLLKLRRRKIADLVGGLAVTVASVERDVLRVYDRVPDVNPGVVEVAAGLCREAVKSTNTAADEFRAFSRRRISYVPGPVGGRR